MSTKDNRIQEIINRSITDIPMPDQEVYDPNDALQDAIKLIKAVFESRLKLYIDSKEENVAFISNLSAHLVGMYPRKKRRKARKALSPEQLADAKKNGQEVMAGLWAIPSGKMYMKLNDDQKKKHASKRGLDWATGKAITKKKA